MTVTFAPGASEPLAGLTLSHVAFGLELQLIVEAPSLLSVSVFIAGVKGPPLLPSMFQPLRSLISRLSGTSYCSTMPVVVVLAGAVAPSPMPRFANAVHTSPKSPGWFTSVACRMPSRLWMKFGFAGLYFIPSVTRNMARSLPAKAPCLIIRLARSSLRIVHHTVPW